MEALREGIGLRGYGQKDPKQEYKKEGFVIFGEMMGSIGRNVCEKLFHMQVQRARRHAARRRQPQRTPRDARSNPAAAPTPRAASGDGEPAPEESKPMRRDQPKVGRNDPCPCGSGKKYKKCHGAVAARSDRASTRPWARSASLRARASPAARPAPTTTAAASRASS